MADVRTSLDIVMTLDGAVGASIVGVESGVPLGTVGGDDLDTELARRQLDPVDRDLELE